MKSSLAILITLVAVLGIYLATMREQLRILRCVARDDWRGVRDVATSLLSRKRRYASGAVVAHAAVVVGVAHLVLGDLPAAREALGDAKRRRLPVPLRAMAERQLASVDRMTGDFDRALNRLALPEARATDDDQCFILTQIGLVQLDRGDGAAAEDALTPAVAAVRRRRDDSRSSLARAYAADLAQAQCLLVRARLQQGDLPGAATLYEDIVIPMDKPYVRAQAREVEARLALARGDRDAAARAADAAVAGFEEVGAEIDVARNGVIQARIHHDRGLLDAAEHRLRQLGALGHLPEVAAARLEII